MLLDYTYWHHVPGKIRRSRIYVRVVHDDHGECYRRWAPAYDLHTPETGRLGGDSGAKYVFVACFFLISFPRELLEQPFIRIYYVIRSTVNYIQRNFKEAPKLCLNRSVMPFVLSGYPRGRWPSFWHGAPSNRRENVRKLEHCMNAVWQYSKNRLVPITHTWP